MGGDTLRTFFFTSLLLVQTCLCSAFSPRPGGLCRAPGVWAHSDNCHIFLLCQKTHHGNFKDIWLLCPDGTGFSPEESLCVEQEKIAACSKRSAKYSIKYKMQEDEKIMPLGISNKFDCKGFDSPYCYSDDILVLCGNNQNLLGAVNCSTRSEVSSNFRHCNFATKACEFLPIYTEETKIGSKSEDKKSSFFGALSNSGYQQTVSTKHNLSLLPSMGIIKITRDLPQKVVLSIDTGADAISSIISPSEHKGKNNLSNSHIFPNYVSAHFPCHQPGQQCSKSHNSVLLECSENLQLLQAWECFDLLLDAFSDNTFFNISCDSDIESCTAFIRHPKKLKKNKSQLPQEKIERLKPFIENKQGICKRSGKQCIEGFSNLLVECSDEMIVTNTWDCRLLFPLDLIIGISQMEVKCVDQEKRCAFLLDEPLRNDWMTSQRELHKNSEKEKEIFISMENKLKCKQPGLQCTHTNSNVIIECSESMKVSNMYMCTSLFPSALFSSNITLRAKCDPHENKCIAYVEEENGNEYKIPKSTNYSEKQEDLSINDTLVCRQPGMKCSKQNGSILFLCSDNLTVERKWNCSSLISSEILYLTRNEMRCDEQIRSCVIVPQDNQNSKVYDSEILKKRNFNYSIETKNALNHEDICKKPGLQCSPVNNNTLYKCNSELTISNSWPCSMFFPITDLSTNSFFNVKCDPFLDKCVVTYIGGEYENVLQNKTYFLSKEKNNEVVLADHNISDDEELNNDTLSYKCYKKGFQCADNITIMDCLNDLGEPNFVMSCKDMMEITQFENVLGYCNNSTSTCMINVNNEVIPFELNLFNAQQHQLFPEFLSKCSEGGLHCADNKTLVMCSGSDDNIDYAITCGYGNSLMQMQRFQAMCEPQEESCIVITHKDMEQLRNLEGKEDTNEVAQNKDHQTRRSFQEEVQERGLLAEPLLYDRDQNKHTNNGNTEYNRKIKFSLTDSFHCHKKGWQCLDSDALIFCSESLSVGGYLLCSETEGKGSWCDSLTSKCIDIPEKTDLSVPCVSPGLQCINETMIGFCSPSLRLQHSVPCSMVHPNDPKSYCNNDLVACVTHSMNLQYTILI